MRRKILLFLKPKLIKYLSFFPIFVYRRKRKKKKEKSNTNCKHTDITLTKSLLLTSSAQIN